MTTTVEFGKAHYHLQKDMIKWCDDNIDDNIVTQTWVSSTPINWLGLGRWCVSSAFGTTFFYFRDEPDATLFLLRWK